MALNKINIFAILAVFCVILSACAVSAADGGNLTAGDIHVGQSIPPDYAHNETKMLNQTGHASLGNSYLNASQDNGAIVPPDYAHDEAKMLNQTGHAAGSDPNLNASQDNGSIVPPDYAHDEAKMLNQTGHAAGENASNHTSNNTITHKLHPTGNPIVILLIVSSVLGGYSVIKRDD